VVTLSGEPFSQRFELARPKQAASRAGEPAMRDRVRARQLVDGPRRAAETLSHVLDEKVSLPFAAFVT